MATMNLHPSQHVLNRRKFLLFSAAMANASPFEPLVISVHVMFDQAAHSGQGLGKTERSKFQAFQQKASREYAISGIQFELDYMEGAYSRKQGYSEIPDKFLAPGKINVFVTDTLGYDSDRSRTGGSSIGPRPSAPALKGNRFYITFLGLNEASESTLAHEYAHHLALDTQSSRSISENFWADLRNDFWLWRQRHGVPIPGFRSCSDLEWAKRKGSNPKD